MSLPKKVYNPAEVESLTLDTNGNRVLERAEILAALLSYNQAIAQKMGRLLNVGPKMVEACHSRMEIKELINDGELLIASDPQAAKEEQVAELQAVLKNQLTQNDQAMQNALNRYLDVQRTAREVMTAPNYEAYQKTSQLKVTEAKWNEYRQNSMAQELGALNRVEQVTPDDICPILLRSPQEKNGLKP